MGDEGLEKIELEEGVVIPNVIHRSFKVELRVELSSGHGGIVVIVVVDSNIVVVDIVINVIIIIIIVIVIIIIIVVVVQDGQEILCQMLERDLAIPMNMRGYVLWRSVQISKAR